MKALCSRSFRPAAVLALVIAASPAFAAEIRLLSGGAPQPVLRALAAEFEQATGHHVTQAYGLVTIIQQKLLAGESADLVLLPVPLIEAIGKKLPLRAEGRGALVRVGIAVIVREGSTQPDISTPGAVRNLLVAARSVAVPQADTPSGAHLAKMIEGLGIADTMRPKLIVKAAINGGGDLVTRGEADVGLYLRSEVQATRGTAVVGALPPQLQSYVVYGSAIPASNATPQPALDLLKFISDPARGARWVAAGFETIATKP